MRFDTQVFISYAHIDNTVVPPQRDGWISRFHAVLEAMLSMRVGSKVRVWRDQKLAGNDVFADEIVQRFSTTALMVSVLTPRYVLSEWCRREMREFCERAEASGGLTHCNKSRLFKVLKLPIDSDQALPAETKGVLGYPFFSIRDGAPYELDEAYGAEFGRDFNLRAAKLAYDLSQLLKQIECDDETPRTSSGQTVYLAECGADRRAFREMIEAELKLHGHTVLPDVRLPLEDEAECIALIAEQLSRATLSVHLIGDSPGPVPDGPSGRSITALQNELAVDASRKHGLERLIWLPEGTRASQPGHQAFIGALQRDADLQFGADLVTADIEQFKGVLHTTLDRPASACEEATTDCARAQPVVFLICVEAERKETVDLRRFLMDEGIAVGLPAFEGDAAAIREANRALLARCDAVLVYYGAGDDAWKRSIDTECLRLGHAAHAALLEVIYLTGPRTADKDDLIALDRNMLIDGFGGFDPDALRPLLKRLRESPKQT